METIANTVFTTKKQAKDTSFSQKLFRKPDAAADSHLDRNPDTCFLFQLSQVPPIQGAWNNAKCFVYSTADETPWKLYDKVIQAMAILLD